MRAGPIVHGALLAAALAAAYQTWTRDEAVESHIGDHLVWSLDGAKLEAIVYESEKKSVRLEVRGEGDESYLWGTVTRRREVPAEVPAEVAAASPDAGIATDSAVLGDAGVAFDAGAAASEADAAAAEIVSTTREFPVGEDGEKLFAEVAELHALRDLGTLSGQQREEYGLESSSETLTAVFPGDQKRSLVLGKAVYDGSARYVLESDSGKAYVLSDEVLRPIDNAETALGLRELHSFAGDEVDSIVVQTEKGDKTLRRAEAAEGEEGEETEEDGNQWVVAGGSGTPDVALSGFIERVQNLKPTEYDASLEEDDLSRIATLVYRGADKKLGSLTLYRQLPAAQRPADAELGGARTQYWVKSERTHAFGKVSRIAAERVDIDLVDLFGIAPGPDTPDEAPPEVAPGIDPRGGRPPWQPRNRHARRRSGSGPPARHARRRSRRRAPARHARRRSRRRAPARHARRRSGSGAPARHARRGRATRRRDRPRTRSPARPRLCPRGPSPARWRPPPRERTTPPSQNRLARRKNLRRPRRGFPRLGPAPATSPETAASPGRATTPFSRSLPNSATPGRRRRWCAARP